nr:putative Ig domain-containing protein [Rudanella lutea]
MTVPRVASTQLINVTNASGNVLTPSSFTVTRASSTLSYDLITNNFANINVGTDAAPTVVDFDRDGLLDLLIGRGDGTVSRYEQTAVNATTFTNLGSLSDGNGTIDMGVRVTVSVVDADGDGRFSVLLGRSDGLVHEYEQTAVNASQLTLVTTSFGGVGTTSYAVVGMTDFSGEGRLEFLTGKGDGIVGYFNQDAVNSPDFSRVNSDYLVLTNNTAPFCVDLDGNGRIDVLIGVGNGTIYRFEQSAVNSTNVNQITNNFNSISAGSNAKPCVTDIDGDGLLDLLVGRADGTIDRYEQDTPNLSPTIAGFSPVTTPVCAEQITTFTATVGNVSPPYAFTLTNGAATVTGNANTTAFSQSWTAGGSGTQTFSLIVSGNGTTVATTTLTVNPLPLASIQVPASTTLTCTTPTITLTASGGGTYRWDNNTTSATRTVNAAGTFSVTVTSANGCTAVDTQVITSNTTPPTANISASATEISCTVPTITLTASGGGTYRWDNNTTSATRTVNAASTYSVTVTSANGCTAVDTQVITSNTTPPTANISASATEISCTVPTITLTASGGGTYRWDNNTTSATRTVNAAGTFSVTVTSANGCTAVDTQVITSNTTPPTANISASATEISCTVPTITLTASGGGTYRWDNNTTSATRTVNAASTYSVTVTSANGCTAVDTQVITSNTTPPTANISASATEISCTVPTITLTASGGGTYRWDNNTTSATRTVNAASTYSVTVTSANGCTAVDTQVITQNTTPPTANISAPATEITCTVPSIILTVTGGGTYRWDNNTTSATRTVNMAGTFSVTVTGANGCTATANATITSTTATLTLTNPVTTTALINVPFSQNFIAAGGQGGYSFSLASGTLPNGLALTTSGNLTGTPTQAGSFSITARAQDANGCVGTGPAYTFQVSTTATVTTAAPAIITGTSASLGGTVSADGGATITESGVVYVVGTGVPTTSNTKVMMAAGVGSYAQLVTGLTPATTYSVRAYAINIAGTSYGNLQTFTTSAAPQAPVVLTPANGSVTNQNRPTYTGTASPGDVVTVRVDDIIIGQATANASGNWSIASSSPLADGPHTVYASVFRDGILSANSNTNSFTVDTTPPPAPVVTTPANGAILSDTTPTYTGTAEAQSTVTVRVDGSPIGTTTADASGTWTFTPTTPLAPGSHTVRVRATDLAGNESVDSNTNTFTVDTAAPTVTITSSSTSPTNSSALSVTFTFSESVNGFDVGDVTVGNGGLIGFSGSGSRYTATLVPASPGLVSVSVAASVAQDAANNGNVASNRFTIDYLPLPTIVGFSASPAIVCTNALTTFTATIGNITGNYSYTLTNGSSTTSGSSSNLTFSQSWLTSGSGVQAFTLTVEGNGRHNATTSVTVNALPVVTLSSSGTLTCAQTSVVLTATGGSNYAFSGQGLNQSGSGNMATVSAAGTYSVLVTDANGCTASATTIVESATNAVNATLVASGTLTCSNPTVTLTAAPAGANYQFSGPGLSQTGAVNTATVSAAGTYSVVITAAGGCSALATVTVSGNTTPPTAGISPSTTTLTCTNPTATLTATGGGTYRWEDNSTSATRTVNAAGTYSVTVTGANGCTATTGVNITGDTTPPTVSLAASGTVSCANPTVTLTASPAGQGTYRFGGPGLNQTGPANTATVSAGGLYSVTLTSANGCTASATTTVESATNAVNATLVASSTITCNNPTVTLTASPAGASYAFSGPGLNQTGASNTATVSAAGTYSVIVTAAGGCSALATVTVQASQELPNLSITANPGTAVVQGQAVTLTATGATSFRWSTGATGASINPPTSATGSTVYSVTGTAPNGCSATAQITLVVSASVTPPPAGVCGSQPGTIGGPLTLLEPIYNCATGQIQFRTSGGNGTPITYAAIGITGPTTSCSAMVDAQVAQDIRDGKPNVEPFTLLATQGNITVMYRWNALAVCAGTPPPTNTPPSVVNAVGPQSATVGVGYSLNVGNVFTDAQTPAALTLSAPGLPAGLALNGSTITGTPSTSGVSTVTLTASDPGGLSNSTSFQLTVSSAGSTTVVPPVGGPLAATVVSYNCQTGAIVFGATGGNGSAVEYLAIGITGWTTNSNQMIEAGLRADPKPVTVQVRQTGVAGQSFVFDFGAFCAGNPQPPTNTAPSVANAVGPQSATVGVGYSLNVSSVFTDAQTPAALTLSASGLPAGLALNGSTLSGTPSTSGVSTVTLTATDPGGLSNSTSFVLTVSPVGGTPPVGGPLAATVVSYNCQTGAIVFGSTGGNGSAVEYFAIGITGWTTNVNAMIEAGLRADPKPVTLRVRQNGVEGTPFVFDFGAFCSRPARVATETASELEVVVLGNPTPESWVEVQVANSAGEALQVRVISAQGRAVSSVSVAPTSQPLRQRVQLGDNAGTYLLQVATPTRTKTVKVVRQ